MVKIVESFLAPKFEKSLKMAPKQTPSYLSSSFLINFNVQNYKDLLKQQLCTDVNLDLLKELLCVLGETNEQGSEETHSSSFLT